MILHRWNGVISSTGLQVVLRAPSRTTRVSLAEFRDGKLDDAILDAFDLKTLVEARARDLVALRGIRLTRRLFSDGPDIQRTWSFGRGDPRCVWIRGRTVSAMAGSERYEATPFEAHVASGFPASIAGALGADTVSGVRAAVLALHPLACFCGTGAIEIDQHDSLDVFVQRSDPNAPVDLQAAVGHCTVCHRGWTFEWGGDSHYEYHYTASPFLPEVGYSYDEVEAIVAAIRGGAEVTIGVSRCNTTYRGKDGTIVAEEFDEGQTAERPCSEETIRQLVRDEPESFLEVLRAPLRAALSKALLENTGAIDRLRALLAYGECLHEVEILEAFLEDKPPPPGKTGLDAYHAVMNAIGYARLDAEGGRFGLRVFEALDPSIPRFRRYRASFRSRVGDHAGALEDLLWEKAHRAADDSDQTSLDKEIEQVRAGTRI